MVLSVLPRWFQPFYPGKQYIYLISFGISRIISNYQREEFCSRYLKTFSSKNLFVNYGRKQRYRRVENEEAYFKTLIRQLGTIRDAVRVARNRVNIIFVPGVLNLFSMQTDGSRGNITVTLRVESRGECRCRPTAYTVTRGVAFYTRPFK